jgi:GTP cyclohydrolase II
MEAAITAALAAVLGLVVGRLWDSRLEVARWRRDQCVRAYEDAASAYYNVRETMRVLALTEPGRQEADVAENRMRTVGVEWNRCMVAVWLHGSEPVVEAIRQVDREFEQLLVRVRSCQLTWEEFWEERRPAGRKLDNFIEEVRKELKRPLMQVRVTST